MDATAAVETLVGCLLPFIDSRDGEARAAAEAAEAARAEEAGKAGAFGAPLQARPRGTGAKVARLDPR